MGKTNLTELAVTAAGTNPWFDTPVNPLDRVRQRWLGTDPAINAALFAAGFDVVTTGVVVE